MKKELRTLLYLVLTVITALVGCSPHAGQVESRGDEPIMYGGKYILTKSSINRDLRNLGHVGSLFSIDAKGNFVKVDYAPKEPINGGDVEPIDYHSDEDNDDVFIAIGVPDSYCAYPPNSWPLYAGKMREYAEGFYWGWAKCMAQVVVSKHETYPVFSAFRPSMAFKRLTATDITDEFRRGVENGQIHAQSDFEFFCREIANGQVKHTLPVGYLPTEHSIP